MGRVGRFRLDGRGFRRLLGVGGHGRGRAGGRGGRDLRLGRGRGLRGGGLGRPRDLSDVGRRIVVVVPAAHFIEGDRDRDDDQGEHGDRDQGPEPAGAAALIDRRERRPGRIALVVAGRIGAWLAMPIRGAGRERLRARGRLGAALGRVGRRGPGAGQPARGIASGIDRITGRRKRRLRWGTRRRPGWLVWSWFHVCGALLTSSPRRRALTQYTQSAGPENPPRSGKIWAFPAGWIGRPRGPGTAARRIR